MRAALAAVAFLSLLGCGAATPDHPPLTGRSEEFPLVSERVGDTYRLFVRLPPGYDDAPETRFPLVLQLDANLEGLEEFQVTAGFASSLESEGRIPPTVIVGIGYPYATAPKVGRNRDYTLPLEHPDTLGGSTTGGAPTFLEFLRDDLLPELERRYRLQGPKGRALLGHSLGGLFVEYAFLQYRSDRPFVTGFVAASPSLWFDSGAIYHHFDAFKARQTDVPLVLFTTVGSLEGAPMTVYFDDLSKRTREAGFTSLRFDARTYREDHLGTIGPSFRDGLVYLFENGLGEPR